LRAPSGSNYHRFPSRGALLGEAWLRAAERFQSEFLRRLTAHDAERAGLDALSWLMEFVRGERALARLLLLHRREDFLATQWPAALKRRARELGSAMQTSVVDYARRLVGRSDARTLRILAYALAEAPLAAVRRHIEADENPPRIVDALIESTYHAALRMARERT
jgi:AcrR family transcriptional regulator